MDPIEDDEEERLISVEFTLLSGETVTSRVVLDEEATEESVQRYAERLIREIGTETVRTFTYWWEGEFYVDAVRMHEVAAISVSTVALEEDDEDEEWDR
ncbi:MAG: hypothetical protein QOF51_2497 [Chloroflexota bacterium]|jgi:hypothetical protein|nr:hypothetical protein [Chloroflexota bacterium]